MAGIPVFVTGGIGGVHYGASECMWFTMLITTFVLSHESSVGICVMLSSILLQKGHGMMY